MPNEDILADMYDLTLQRLTELGLHRYEVSNFSRSLNTQCEHNKGYWKGSDYIGLGPGAHSRFRPMNGGLLSQQIAAHAMRGKVQNIYRTADNIRDARIQTLEPDAWMREVELVGHGTRKIDNLTSKDVLSELLATSLRTDNGLTETVWLKKLDYISSHLNYCVEKIRTLSLKSVIEDDEKCLKFVENGTLILNGDNSLRLSPDGLKYLDHVLPYLINRLRKRVINLLRIT